MTTAPAPRATPATYVGVFLVTLSTLMLEISLTRIFSVTMWYHFAFVAISVALFGLTAGALIVHLRPAPFSGERVKQQLWRIALGYSAAIVVCFAIQLQIPFRPHLTPGGVASIIATCIVISVPFIGSGVVVCLALTRFPGQVNRLYAVDLVGAGLGCVALLALFSWLDGPSLVILIGSLAAGAAVAFAVGAGHRAGAAAATACMLVLGGFALVNAELQQDGDGLLEIEWVKEQRDAEHDLERWNAFSRLTVDGDPDDPATQQLDIVIDSTAGTHITRFDGDLTTTDGLRGNIQNLAHHLRPDADVFVIGVGGGVDVLSALEFEQRSVTGVEINTDIVDLLTGRFGEFAGHLDEDPTVAIVNDEARSYLARTDDRFDLIQISLIDTWAATGAGAFALTENSLYTVEGWDLFLDRLQPGGIFTVTRFFQTQTATGEPTEPFETYRTVALAAETLTDRGVTEPRDHLAIYRAPTSYGVDLATVLVSAAPLTDADLAGLERQATEHGFEAVLTPGVSTDPTIEALVAPGGPGPALDRVAADISPPTDDQPFFFQMADVDTFLDGDIWRDDFITRPVLVLTLLAGTVLLLAALCIALPLALGRRQSRDPADRRRARPFYVYFGGIGFGFLLLEVAQLQRLSSFLGHPVYGLSVVLFSILVFSGIGSLLTERFLRTDRPRTLLAPLVVLLAVVAVSGVATVPVLHAFDGATTPMRALVAVALLAPMATVMGMPFAIGMRTADATDGVPTAYLWGINGATSVSASVLGVAIALFAGISISFWSGAVAYAVALAAMVVITRRGHDAVEVGDAPLDLDADRGVLDPAR
jgi:hypothetical protein